MDAVNFIEERRRMWRLPPRVLDAGGGVMVVKYYVVGC